MEAGASSLTLINRVPGWSDVLNAECLGDPALEAYNDAVKLFNEKLTNDECKRIWLRDKTDIQQVQRAVTAAKEAYDAKSEICKARKWLSKLSSRVLFYSSVIDMMAQHHPEYVALAWGTIKFFLTALVNHEKLLAQLSKALTRIADALPRIEVKALLYQTPRMKNAVSMVYAHIIKFFQRAVSWYAEGKIKHITSAILRPFELRFKDLVDEIARCSRNVDQLAFAATQMELREMHLEQRDLHLVLLDLRRIIIENQALNFRGFLDSKRRICEIQFSQILTVTATTSLLSPEESFRFCQFLSTRRRLRAAAETLPPWRSRKLQEWASSSTSSLILIQGTSLHRHETKDFATDIVGLLRTIKIPVVWTLSAKEDGNPSWRSPIDVLKQLVLQVLQVNQSLLNELSPALNAARFQCATTEQQWFELLASVLVGLPQIYIVVDAGVLSQEFSSQILWPMAFLKLFDDLAKNRSKTIVKVVLVSYGTTPFVPASPSDPLEDATIRIGGVKRLGGAARGKPQFRSPGARVRQGADLLRPFVLRSSTIQPSPPQSPRAQPSEVSI